MGPPIRGPPNGGDRARKQVYIHMTRQEGLRIPAETPCAAGRRCALALREVCYGEVNFPARGRQGKPLSLANIGPER